MTAANPSQPESLGRLSDADAAQLASGIAQLTKSGLPLPDGLRAMAEEWPSRRLRPVLLIIADNLEKGVSLNDAMNAIGSTLPAHLKGLVTAGIRTGRLAEALNEYINIERTQDSLRRQVWLNLIYPAILLIAITLLSAIVTLFIVEPIGNVFKDFGAQIPGITYLLLHWSGFFTSVLFIITILLIAIPILLVKFPGNQWLAPMLYIVPFIGKLLKWSETARFSRFMSMFLEQQVPLADALKLTAGGLRDGYLARSCRQAAVEIEDGRSFSQTIGSSHQFSSDLLPLIVVGEQSSRLPDSLNAAAEMFESRANSQGKIFDSLFMPFAYLFIAFFCGFVVLAIYMPLISLITHLTGGGGV